jgi:hypothetical protein
MKGKKTGGRNKGTPNKTTSEIRELINELSFKYLDDDLSKLEPKDRLLILTKLLSYSIPRPATNEEDNDSMEPIVIVLTEPSKTLSKVD